MKLQKQPKLLSVRRIQILSLNLSTTLPFEKFWLRALLVEGMQNVLDCMHMKSSSFATLNFISRFTFDSSFVFDPLKLEITINFGVVCVCSSPIDYTIYAVCMPSLTCVVGMRLFTTLRFKIWL